jgi:hypothetical protein
MTGSASSTHVQNASISIMVHSFLGALLALSKPDSQRLSGRTEGQRYFSRGHVAPVSSGNACPRLSETTLPSARPVSHCAIPSRRSGGRCAYRGVPMLIIGHVVICWLAWHAGHRDNGAKHIQLVNVGHFRMHAAREVCQLKRFDHGPSFRWVLHSFMLALSNTASR